MLKVLITGGAGYLGTVTALELATSGHQVVCLDVCSEPPSWAAWAQGVQGVSFMPGDVRLDADVLAAAESMDALIHMAFVVGGRACTAAPNEARCLALCGTRAVLGASRGKLLVFTSTDAVYGNRARGLVTEDLPCRPDSLYGELKLECEGLVRSAEKSVVLRLPSHFGASPKMRSDLLVHYLALQMSRHGRLCLSEPNVTRTLVHARDAARCIRHVVENSAEAAGKVFNVATGSWKKTEIAETIKKVFGGDLSLDGTFNDPETRDFVLDCSGIRSIGWRPAMNLENGIRSLREWVALVG